jgi:hypothetical protein
MKRLSRGFLDQYGWEHVYVGSSVVTFCEKCECQRTHTCIGKTWEDDDWTFEFECDHCRYDTKQRKHHITGAMKSGDRNNEDYFKKRQGMKLPKPEIKTKPELVKRKLVRRKRV